MPVEAFTQKVLKLTSSYNISTNFYRIALICPKTTNWIRMGQILGQKSKAPKGEISIENNDGRIRLRWRYNGGRYSLSLPYPYTPENMHHATIKVAEIKLDILKDCFDTSLGKYKPEAIKSIITSPVQKIAPIAPSIVYVNGLADRFSDRCIYHLNYVPGIRLKSVPLSRL